MAKLPEDGEVTKAQSASSAKTAEAEPTQYIITTPKNPEYNARVMGVQFAAGRAVVNAAMLDPRLKKTLAQIIQEFRELDGYVVTPA